VQQENRRSISQIYLIGIQEVRLEKGGDELPEDFKFSLEKAIIMMNY